MRAGSKIFALIGCAGLGLSVQIGLVQPRSAFGQDQIKQTARGPLHGARTIISKGMPDLFKFFGEHSKP